MNKNEEDEEDQEQSFMCILLTQYYYLLSLCAIGAGAEFSSACRGETRTIGFFKHVGWSLHSTKYEPPKKKDHSVVEKSE